MAAFLPKRQGNEVSSRDVKVFQVDLTPLFYSHVHNKYLQEPQSKRLGQTNVSKHALHFYCNHSPFNIELVQMRWNLSGNMTSPQLLRDKSDVQRPALGELVFRSRSDSYGSKALPRPK